MSIKEIEELRDKLVALQDEYQETFDALMKERLTEPDSLLTEPITTNFTIALQSIYVARVALAGSIRDYKKEQETKDEN